METDDFTQPNGQQQNAGVRVKTEPGIQNETPVGSNGLPAGVRVKTEPGMQNENLAESNGLPSNVRVKTEPGTENEIPSGSNGLPAGVRVKTEPGIQNENLADSNGLPSNVRVKIEVESDPENQSDLYIQQQQHGGATFEANTRNQSGAEAWRHSQFRGVNVKRERIRTENSSLPPRKKARKQRRYFDYQSDDSSESGDDTGSQVTNVAMRIGEIVSDVFPCTRCHLAFQTKALLRHHIGWLHQNENLRKRRGRERSNGVPNHNEDGDTPESDANDVEYGEASGSMDYGVNVLDKEVKDVNRDSMRDPFWTMDNSVLNPDGHPCTYCDKSFRNATKLVIHLKSIHKEANPHRCICCGKKFRKSRSLRRHVKHEHRICPQ